MNSRGFSETVDIELFGLFELDPSGTVLYHRVDPPPPGESRALAVNISGLNFYDEVAPFENTKEFREYVTEFTHSAKFADSFYFECQRQGNGQPVKVLLARISE